MTVAASPEAEPPAPTSPHFAEIVRRKSEDRVSAYTRKGDWNVYRSLKDLVEQAIRDYEHRAVLELVQNAHDAHPDDRRDGRIAVLLDADEGDHGVLYVANGGRPFSESNFDAICDIAQSDKRPDEGIGNKGIGFKSTLQICRSPEIYSLSPEGSSSDFDGFCFRYSTDADFLELANGDASLARDLARDVFHLCLPVPAHVLPEATRAFRDGGFSTVVRLPLKSAAAYVEAAAELRALQTDPPALLFLRRIHSLTIEVREGGDTHSRALERTEDIIYSQADTLTCALADIGGESYALLEKSVDVRAFRDAIAAGVVDDRMSDKWLAWSGEARVAVGVRLTETPADGRLYAFLPMGATALSPLAAHVHAPFFSKLARVELEETVPLNSFLLDEVADLCAQSAGLIAKGLLKLPRHVALDLICWSDGARARIRSAFARAGSSLPEASVIPASQPPDTWTTLAAGRLWSEDAMAVLKQARVYHATGTPLLDAGVGPERLRRLAEISRSELNRTLDPTGAELAHWAERVAQDLAKHPFQRETWEGFYDDLANALPPKSWSELRGRRILIDDDVRLQRTPSPDAPRGATPFFSPRSEEAAGDNPDVDLRPPPTLRRKIFFIHQGLRWNLRSGQTLSKRPGRRLLDAGLVNEYRAEELFRQIGRSLGSSKSQTVYKDVLRWVYQIALSRRDPPWADIKEVGLLVPLKSGKWRPAKGALLSPEWGDETARLLDELINYARDDSAELAKLGDRLIATPDAWPFPLGNRDSLRDFLQSIGVKSGLWPEAVSDSRFEATGSSFEDGAVIHVVPNLTAAERATWKQAVSTRLPTGLRPATRYVADTPLFKIPGQGDLSRLNWAAQRRYALLVAHGVKEWDGGLQVLFRRYNDPYDNFIWPTPAGAFIEVEPWVPAYTPGQVTDWEFHTASASWSYGSVGESPPHFVPRVPDDVRLVWAGNDRAAARLRAAGLRYWNETSTGGARVATLASMLLDDAVPDSAALSFKKAYEEAWSDVVTSKSGDPLGGNAGVSGLVVTRRGRPNVYQMSDAEPFYVQDVEESQALRLLDQQGIPLLRLAARHGSAVAGILAPRFTDRLRRLSAAHVSVRVDGEEFVPGSVGQPLITEDNRWLIDLIAVVIELRSSQFRRVSAERLRRAIEQARLIRIVYAEALEAWVDDVSVDLPATRRVLAVPASAVPSIVIEGSTGLSEAELLEAITPAIAELIGYSELADALSNTLHKVTRVAGGRPDAADIAGALGESTHRIDEIREGLRLPALELARVLTPVVAVYDVELALRLWRAVDGLDSGDAVWGWLFLHVADPDPTPGVAALQAACSTLDLERVRTSLSINLRALNMAIVELGPPFEELHNTEGIDREFRFYVQRNRDSIMNQLRMAFLDAYRRAAALDQYTAVRDLQSIPLDPAWVDEFVELPPHEMETWVEKWLVNLGVVPHTALPDSLPPIDQVRTQNRVVVASIAETVGDLVHAWELKGKKASGRVLQPADAVEASMQAGLLDFEPLDEGLALKWFLRDGYWPPELKLTLEPSANGLSAEDVLEAARLRQEGTLEKRRARRQLIIDGRPFSAEQGGYADIVDAVRSGITTAFTASAKALASLQTLPPGDRSSHPPGSRAPVTAAKRPQPSQEQINAIGLAGEVAALEWLRANYEGVTEDAWRSGYRNLVLGDEGGDDSLGFDFEILTPKLRLLFEVKATTSDDTEFDLTDREIRAAQGVSRGEQYWILRVEHALNSERRRMLRLPNPFATIGSTYYRTVGTGLRLQFKLST